MAKLSLQHVTKRYGSKVAVDNISFEAQAGRVMGLLGPNGAGKTSTIRMITYITTPDDGAVLFDNAPVGAWSQERMGYLPEERGLYKKLKVNEQLVYLAELKGLKKKVAIERIDYWLNRFDALDWKAKKTQELSKGMQQKIQFISTILHEPDLLILDEPFSGLDPINTEVLKDVIEEQKSQNRVILFASHRMEQVEQLCDDICLISEGKILIQGSLRDVKQRFGRNQVIMEYQGGEKQFLSTLALDRKIEIVHETSNRAEIKLIEGTSAREVLEHTLAHTESIFRFECAEPSLNEIFVTAVESDTA